LQVMDEVRRIDVLPNRALPNGGDPTRIFLASESVPRTTIEAVSSVVANARPHIFAQSFVRPSFAPLPLSRPLTTLAV